MLWGRSDRKHEWGSRSLSSYIVVSSNLGGRNPPSIGRSSGWIQNSVPRLPFSHLKIRLPRTRSNGNKAEHEVAFIYRLAGDLFLSGHRTTFAGAARGTGTAGNHQRGEGRRPGSQPLDVSAGNGDKEFTKRDR